MAAGCGSTSSAPATDGREGTAAASDESGSDAEHAARLCTAWRTHHPRAQFSTTNAVTAAGAMSFLRDVHPAPVHWLHQVPASEFVAVCVETHSGPALCVDGGAGRWRRLRRAGRQWARVGRPVAGGARHSVSHSERLTNTCRRSPVTRGKRRTAGQKLPYGGQSYNGPSQRSSGSGASTSPSG